MLDARPAAGFDFIAAEPVCPQCRADQRNPKLARFIVDLVDVHFDPPTEYPGVGQGVRACSGQPTPGRPATGDPGAVTCAACKLTEAWKKASADWGFEVIEEITPERAEALRRGAATSLRAFQSKVPAGPCC